MDIRITGPEATALERAAVDEVLGAPGSGWTGGARDMAREGWTSTAGAPRAAWADRHLLLPVLHALQDCIGWVSRGALNYVSLRMTLPPADAWGVASFYHLFALEPQAPVVAHVCDDIACRAQGAEQLCGALATALGPEGEAVGQTTWRRSPCLGLCEQAPAVLVLRAGAPPATVTLGEVDSAATVVGALAPGAAPPAAPPIQRIVPQAGVDPSLRLLQRVGQHDPISLEAYRKSGGYEGLGRADALGAAKVIEELTASRLVGRGGAAFPTGRKWQAVAEQPESTRYVVCNADESEPGTFKDRVLMEWDPFAVVEGMTIAGLATAAQRGFLYVRGEYPLATARLAAALDAARGAGLLGPARGFDIELRRGAGAYICGEETALFNSIEGKRGEPRNKPPFPVQAGLFGKPTVVNNVETLANVPLVLRDGAAAYAAIGTAGLAGPKLFCVSGQVERPGLYELPFGATLRQVIELAGGVVGGRPLRAVLLGGAAGTFVGPDTLDTPLTFEALRPLGASLGSGVIFVLDDSVDLPDLLGRMAAFFRDESCGQCVPCRVGTVRQDELLARLRSGATLGTVADELTLLTELGQAMRDASICGLGQTASSAIESALVRLRVDPRAAAPGSPA